MYVQGNEVSLGNYEAQLGLPNNFGQTGFPAIGSNLIMPYGGSQWNYGMSQIISTLDENMNKVWGKHQLAFGGRYRHERFGYMSDHSPDQIAFTNLATAIYDPTTGANYGAKPNTGYADADFFLGAASSYSQNKNAPFNTLACRSSTVTSRTTGASARVSPSMSGSAGRRIRRRTPIRTTWLPST